MPSVAVLPLVSTTVGIAHPGADVRLLETIAQPEGMPEVNPVEKEGMRPSDGKPEDPASTPTQSNDERDLAKPLDRERKDSISAGGTVSPSQSSSSYPQVIPSHLTPQQPGYYVAYQSQVTPESPSPATGPVYDVGSFLQQPAGFQNSFAGHQYGSVPGQSQAPPSPSQNSMGGIPPASPLFPRYTQQTAAGLIDGSMAQQRVPTLSPGPYLSPALGPSGVMYPTMGAYGGAGNNSNGGYSNDGFSGWGDKNNPQVSPYPHNSSQVSAQGIPIPYVPGMPPRIASAAGRSYSFEETMLPPPADSQQHQQDHTASFPQYGQTQYGQTQYGQTQYGQNSPATGAPGTLFAHQQPWGYAGPPPDMYGASASPLQPRPTMPYPGMQGGPPRHQMPPMSPYGGQFFPATSPGPPIQTTASNKGPDGANLFVFHIPNHFTNLDMYQLFCPYGNLLSVRIMVEKDTGRSRGFGFVSYDSPDAAALAIKELNGFAIGNKRLKVQHKQIRPSDQHQDRSNQDGYVQIMGGDQQGGNGYEGAYRGQISHALPPSGPMAGSHPTWYDGQEGVVEGQEGVETAQTHLPTMESGPPEEFTGVGDPLSGFEPLRQALPDVSNEAPAI